MARSSHQNTTAPAMLPMVIAVLVVTSLLPARYSTPWVKPIAGQAELVFNPIARPFSLLGQVFTPPRFDPGEIDPETAKSMIDDLQTRLRQLEHQNEDLRRENEIITKGGSIQRVPVRLLLRAVSEPGGKLMRVRGGSNEGVTRNSIATAGMSQLVGRVQDVEARTCVVQPITAKDADLLSARVVITPDRANGLECLLTPLGDGTLRGDVAAEGSDQVAVGQTVVLDDNQWPRHAQMLVIGLVESVTDHPVSSARKVITVRPTVSVRRVAEVYLRVPLDASGAEGTP